MKDFLLSLGLDGKIINQILERHRAEVETLQSSNTELNKALELSKQETDARDKQLKELSKIDIEGTPLFLLIGLKFLLKGLTG